jgi:signal transduction histidine kinase
MMEKRTVLFVDDESNILKSLNRLLRSEPYQSLFAQGGEEALDILGRESVNVIITDLGMPEMDGFTLLKQVQENYPDVIRLVLSVSGDTDSILKAINKESVYRYILKPWEERELKIIIRQATEMFNLQEEKRNLLTRLDEHNRLLEQRVKERTRQLLAIESAAEIGKYASQIVHNLNNPLFCISGALDMFEVELSDDNTDLNKLQKWTKMAKSGTSDLKDIILGILIHVRDKTKYEKKQIDVNEIIKSALDFFQINPFFKNKIKKQVDLSDNLPPILGDSIQIKQIVDNLIKNAIDAMEHSEEKRLTVKTGFEDKCIAIIISDTGEGISEEDLSNIFCPYFTTKPIGKGTGLGLASVKAMVDAYSGTIHVESKNREGTTFIVRLPGSVPRDMTEPLVSA